MEFEDVLGKVGGYGKYQKHLLIGFLVPVVAVLPLAMFVNLFFLSVPEHWCHVPELESLNLTTKQDEELQSLGIRTSCSALEMNYSTLLSPDGTLVFPKNATSRNCEDGWRYDQSNYDFTAATQWNMVCDMSYYPSFILTMANIGSIIGTPVYGFLSDRFGRKRTIFITIFVFCITTISSVFVTNLTAFVALRAINYSTIPAVYEIPIVLILELVEPDKRARVNGVASTFWTTGMGILPFIAWLSGNWKILGISTTVIVAAIFLYWPMVPESPRWLITHERYNEATNILLVMAKKNSRSVDAKEIKSLLQRVGKNIENEGSFGSNLSAMNFLKKPQLRKKFLIITYSWAANFAVYSGLQINGYNLVGNEFVNFFILGIAEIPGYFGGWMLMEKIGRRWCNVLALTCTGVACLVPVVFKNDTGNVVVSFVGKLGASMAYVVTYQQASELYPTPVRAIGIGLSASFATVVMMGTPYIVYWNKYGEFIPFLVMAFITLTAALAVSFLPETLNENLPQTIDDAESFGLVQNYFSCGTKKPSATRTSTAILAVSNF